MSYNVQFSAAILNITQINSSIQQALVSIGRIFELLDSFTYKFEQFGLCHISEIKGIIHFKNVGFSYCNNIEVLKNLSFSIAPNKKIAIVGPSGSGKTTIFNLLLRFYDPLAGTILIDEIQIQDFTEESLRRHLAIVRQEPFLFNITIRENLLLRAPAASEDTIQTACKSAYIHSEIMKLPLKYDTIIGEGSSNFSTGQKQRLAIARIFLQNSKIVLFDEATSALDNESQFFIKKALDDLSKERTILIIAHRLMTIIDADEIIVLENGCITGHGKHSDLIKNNETYIKLYEKEIALLKNDANQRQVTINQIQY